MCELSCLYLRAFFKNCNQVVALSRNMRGSRTCIGSWSWWQVFVCKTTVTNIHCTGSSSFPPRYCHPIHLSYFLLNPDCNHCQDQDRPRLSAHVPSISVAWILNSTWCWKTAPKQHKDFKFARKCSVHKGQTSLLELLVHALELHATWRLLILPAQALDAILCCR